MLVVAGRGFEFSFWWPLLGRKPIFALIFELFTATSEIFTHFHLAIPVLGWTTNK
jgi:hypothetical protein